MFEKFLKNLLLWHNKRISLILAVYLLIINASCQQQGNTYYSNDTVPFTNKIHISSDSLVKIQVNYLSGNSLTPIIDKEHNYQGIYYKQIDDKLLKELFDELILYIDSSKIKKRVKGDISYEHNDRPEYISMFLGFQDTLSRQSSIYALKLLLSEDPKVNESDFNYMLIGINGNTYYLPKTELLTKIIKGILTRVNRIPV